MMLADYSAYDEVLRQLVTADPENEIEHIQNIVLNMLAFDLAEETDDRFSEIQRWLARLRELDEEGVSGEFEAGIYSMGGFNTEAIASYRRALVLHPENSDNLLLMADLMKSSNRRDEAVAILQYVAEHAGDDAEFVVAVDGIINMIGARTFTEELTPAMRRTFRWSQRIILERIAGHNDKFYLYQLLGDIAQEVGDDEAEFRAVENSLSEAGVRRPSVLRELVTLATAEAGFAGFSTGAGDPERQITHGRRLIALRQELPPEVFINLGKVLLEEDAVQAAVQAFDLINDITGLINVDQTKADLFLDAGYADEALNWYTRALNVSRDDLTLLSRTAMLRESRGQDDVASALYLRAVGNVLRTLATKRVEERPGADASPLAGLGLGPDTSVTRDYRTYFEYLVQGLLTNWPDDPKVAEPFIESVRAMFDTELALVLARATEGEATPEAEPEGPELEQFTRLDRIVRFARRVADRAGDTSLDKYLDGALKDHFNDRAESVAEVETNVPLLRRHMENARRNDDFEAAVRLARLAGNEHDLLGLFRGRIEEGSYREGLAYARSLLDTNGFRRLVAAIAATLKDNARSFLELIREDADLVMEIESDLGREIVTVEELFDILEDPAAQEDSGVLLFLWSDGVWKYLKARATVDDQLRHLVATAARQKRGEYGSPVFTGMFHDLLKIDLSEPQRDVLVEAAADYLAKQDLRSEYAQSSIFNVLLASDPHPANLAILYELGGQAQRMAQMAIDAPGILKGILEGTDEEAFSRMLELERAGVRYWGSTSGADEKYAPIRARILDSARRGDTDYDAQTVRMVYQFEFANRYFFVGAPRVKMKRRAELLPVLIERYPDDHRYLRELVMASLDLAQWDRAEKALFACYESDPEDEILRAALYYLLTYRERYDAALALVTDGGPDLRETQAVEDLLEKVRAARGFVDPGGSSQLFRRIYRGALEPTWSYLSPQADRGVDVLRELAAEDVEPENDLARKTLRTVWRGALAPDEQRAFGPGAGYLINFLLSLPVEPESESAFGYFPGTSRDFRLDVLLEEGDPTDRPTLFETIATKPLVPAEFDLYLRSLPDDERREQHRFYRLLGKASNADDLRLEALSARIGELGDHDFTVWMLLRHEQGDDLSGPEYDAFSERAKLVKDPTALQILVMARLHAGAGAFDHASEHYRLLTANLARHREFMGTRGLIVLGRSGEAPVNLAELALEVAETLPPDVARDTVESIIVSARRADRHDAYTAYFDTFLLRVLAHMSNPEEALNEARRFSPTATNVDLPLGEWDAAKAVELVRLHAMAGHSARAVELLRGLLGSGAGSPGELSTPQQQERYQIVRALQHLGRLYGLRQLQLHAGTPPPLHDLILRRERPFPARPEHHWPGDVAWMTSAADVLVSWLDDPDLERATVLEAAFVVAWQLHTRGELDHARTVVSKLADKVTADPKRLGLQHLVLMTLRVGNTLPPELAAEALARGNLNVEQEVEIIEGLHRASDPATALRIGRVADNGDKLAVMRVLAPLADTVGEEEYARDLKDRIDASEEARRGLQGDKSA